MKTKIRRLAVVAVAGAAVGGVVGGPAAVAQAPAGVGGGAAEQGTRLRVGDKAPALKVGAWVKGEAVKGLAGDRVHVVEFWATWCGPCKRSIPHLTELQGKHKDTLTVVGVSIWENTAGSQMTQEAVEKKVREFVVGQGDGMNYTVAVDDATSEMARTWMSAAGLNGIPAAFIVGKDGVVAWIGNPLTGEFDEALGKVLEGTFDVKAEAQRRADEEARVKRFNEAMGRVSALQQEGKAKEAVGALEESMKEEKDPIVKGALARTKFGLLLGSDETGAYGYGNELLTGDLKDSADDLAQLGETIAITDSLKKPDLELAVKMGERARAITEGKNPGVLHRLATVYAKKGEYQKAIDSQKAAIAKMKEQMGEEKAAPMASFMQTRIDQWSASMSGGGGGGGEGGGEKK